MVKLNTMEVADMFQQVCSFLHGSHSPRVIGVESSWSLHQTCGLLTLLVQQPHDNKNSLKSCLECESPRHAITSGAIPEVESSLLNNVLFVWTCAEIFLKIYLLCWMSFFFIFSLYYTLFLITWCTLYWVLNCTGKSFVLEIAKTISSLKKCN